MLNKVLKLGNLYFISSLAIIRYSNPLVLRVIIILGLVIVLSFKDKERQHKLATSTNSSNQGNLLIITRLASNRIKTNLYYSNYFNRPPYAYLEACLVKVIGIFIKDTILSFYASYQLKLQLNNYRVTTQDSIVVPRL